MRKVLYTTIAISLSLFGETTKGNIESVNEILKEKNAKYIYLGELEKDCYYSAAVRVDESGSIIKAENVRECLNKKIEPMGESKELHLPKTAAMLQVKDLNMKECKTKGVADSSQDGYTISCHRATKAAGQESYFETIVVKNGKFVDRIIDLQ